MGNKNCPKCHSSLVVDNAVATHSQDHALIHTTTHTTLNAPKHPYVALAMGAVLAVRMAVEFFKKKYKCTICQHTFS